MNKKNLNVAIVGAGLNGLAMALSLRMFGIEARLYEKADEPRADGAGIILWPEGMQVLAALIGTDTVLSKCNTVNAATTMTADGKLINQTLLSENAGSVNAPMGLFHRRDLYQILLDAYGKENVITSSPCEVLGGKLTINGEPIEADVIIGTDGIFSKVRECVAPDITVRYSGVKCCRGLMDIQIPEIEDDQCYVFAGDKSRIVSYTYNREKRSKYWFAACRLEPGQVLDQSLIAKRFGYYSAGLLDMIAATPEENILASEMVDLAPFSQWSRDNMVLVGDACCAVLPTMGIGLTLGIENGFILAQALASGFNDISRAFQRYEARAMSRSHALQNINNQLSELTYHGKFDPVEIGKLYQRFTEEISRSPF